MDQQGRIWASTDTGVKIIEPNGNVVEWGPGQVMQLVGKIYAIATIGNGPTMPKLGPMATGSIKGQVIRFGTPLAFVDVEICRAPKLYFRGSPCSHERFHQRVKTGADGGFVFQGVPVATYRFAIKVDRKWRVTFRDCCSSMQPGQTFHVGSINLNR